MAVNAVVFGQQLISVKGALMSFNMLLITIVSTAFGFAFCTIIKTENGRAAASNTFSLGFSFISGCFVPASMLSPAVLKIAAFTPTYWYVKANDTLQDAGKIGNAELKKVMLYFVIELLFSAAILSVGLVGRKKKAV